MSIIINVHMKLYVHTGADILPVTVPEQERVAYLRSLVEGLTEKQDVQLAAFPSGEALKGNVVLGGMFDEQADVYVVHAEERKQSSRVEAPEATLQYITLTTYSFYEDNEDWVKVIVPLEGIKTHPKEEIQAEFHEKSFSIKVHNLQGRHYIFGVPRMQCKVQPSLCKYLRGNNKLVISLRKVKSSDNWHSLFKAKTVGGDDSD